MLVNPHPHTTFTLDNGCKAFVQIYTSLNQTSKNRNSSTHTHGRSLNTKGCVFARNIMVSRAHSNFIYSLLFALYALIMCIYIKCRYVCIGIRVHLYAIIHAHDHNVPPRRKRFWNNMQSLYARPCSSSTWMVQTRRMKIIYVRCIYTAHIHTYIHTLSIFAKPHCGIGRTQKVPRQTK